MTDPDLPAFDPETALAGIEAGVDPDAIPPSAVTETTAPTPTTRTVDDRTTSEGSAARSRTGSGDAWTSARESEGDDGAGSSPVADVWDVE